MRHGFASNHPTFFPFSLYPRTTTQLERVFLNCMNYASKLPIPCLVSSQEQSTATTSERIFWFIMKWRFHYLSLNFFPFQRNSTRSWSGRPAEKSTCVRKRVAILGSTTTTPCVSLSPLLKYKNMGKSTTWTTLDFWMFCISLSTFATAVFCSQ